MNENWELSLTNGLHSDTKGQAESYCYSHSSPSALNTNFLTCQVPRWTSRRMFDRRRLVLSKPDRNFINMGLGKMDRERGKSIGSSASSDRAVSRWPGEEHARVFLSPPSGSPIGSVCPVAFILWPRRHRRRQKSGERETETEMLYSIGRVEHRFRSDSPLPLSIHCGTRWIRDAYAREEHEAISILRSMFLGRVGVARAKPATGERK